jgi:hypothetical protein
MTQTMTPNVMEMARAIRAIRARGVQITNHCSYAFMNVVFSWGYVETIFPGQTSPPVIPPPWVTDYSVIVFQVPPGCTPWRQLFQNDPTAPIYHEGIQCC